MKVRIGFVSNSSSSSFCAYGVSLDWYEVDPVKLALGIKKNFPERYKELFSVEGEDREDYDDIEMWDKALELEDENVSEEMEEFLDNQKFDLVYMIESDRLDILVGEEVMYIGKRYDGCDDDLTFGEFRDIACKDIRDLCLSEYGFEDSLDFRHIETTVST